jgi:hypothetical protein
MAGLAAPQSEQRKTTAVEYSTPVLINVPSEIVGSTLYPGTAARHGVCCDGAKISQTVYCGRENGVMVLLEARGVAEGDRTSIWQAVIVDLFSGGTA